MGDEERNFLKSLLHWVGLVGGAVVGLGALAFAAGFLAQRAQYDFAQVPFMFVDYWAYAEVGLMGVLSSVYILLERPVLPLLLLAASVAIVLLLEHVALWDRLLKPHWVLLGSVLVVVVNAMTLAQGLAVHAVRRSSAPPPSQLADRDRGGDAVPAIAPFRWFLSSPVTAPRKAGRLPQDSFEGWRLLADELEARLAESRPYLELRPRPDWALVSGGAADGSFLGITVPREALDEARARSLYRMLVASVLFVAWACLLLALGERQVLRRLPDQQLAENARRLTRVLFRLKEEMWFVLRWIMRPLSLVLLAATLSLLPECYGVLAMPRLAQEFVDVVLAAAPETKPTAASAPHGPQANEGEENDGVSDPKTVDGLVTRGRELVTEAWNVEPGGMDRLHGEWRAVLERLEKLQSTTGTQALRGLAAFASVSTPALAGDAWAAWNRSAERTSTTVSGFILYYPRSETDYLRVVTRDPVSAVPRWILRPIKMSSIIEIRVRQDEDSRTLVSALRSLREMDPSERSAAMGILQYLGHPRTLDVFMAAAVDPSPMVAGPAITNVGGFASAIPADPDRQYQRRQAIALLLSIVKDASSRPDTRGAAGTAVHLVAREADDATCGEVAQALENQQDAADELWETRGVLITSLGKMGCRSAEPVLLRRLEDKTVPVRVRSSIPTILTLIGSPASVPVLIRVLESPDMPSSIRGTAITAVGILRQRENGPAVRSLVKAVEGRPGTPTREQLDERLAAITALKLIGDRAALPVLERLIFQAAEPEERIRLAAILAIVEMSSPRSAQALLSLAEDPRESERTRGLAILALGRLGDSESAYRVNALFDDAGAKIRKAIVMALAQLGQGGSSVARDFLEERRSELMARSRMEQQERIQQELRQLLERQQPASSDASAEALSPEAR